MNLQITDVPLPVRMTFDTPLTDEELQRFSERNDVVWIEREAVGTLYAKPIWDTLNGGRGTDVNFALHVWAETDGRGTCCGGSGWLLPDGSMRGPHVSWVLKERLATRSKKELKGFAKLSPDFIVADFERPVIAIAADECDICVRPVSLHSLR